MSELYISKLTLPSGGTYEIKDAAAREAIAALEGGSYFLGVTTTELEDQATTNPVVIDDESVTATNGNIVVYGNSEFIFNGTKWIEFGDLSNLGALAYKDSVSLAKGSGVNVLGASATFAAAPSAVSFSGSASDSVLGADTTFTASASAVSFSGGASDSVLGEDTEFELDAAPVLSYTGTQTGSALGASAEFSTSVTPSTSNLKATASGAAVNITSTAAAITGFGAHSTENFVTSVSETDSKLVTTSIAQVSGNTDVVANKSTWSFAMGSGNDAETLIISGGNGSDVTASKVTTSNATVATGAVDAQGAGSSIVTAVSIGSQAAAITALGTPTTANAATAIAVSAQPTIALALNAEAGTGVVSVATGISSASTTVSDAKAVTALTNLGTASITKPSIQVKTADLVSAVTSIGTATAAAQSITVGSSDLVNAVTNVGTGTAAAQTISVSSADSKKVALFDDLSVSVS